MKLPRPRVLQAFVLVLCLSVGLFSLRLRTQSAAQAPSRPPTPEWQIDAGGKMAFNVASVKQDTAEPSSATVQSNIALGPHDFFTPTGGLLSATNYPLSQYMLFAYKLTVNQTASLQSQLPKWALNNRYDIEARGPANATKDQFRLMVQALLAERFKLAIHYETRQLPVMALVLDKPGKLGAHLKPHPKDSPCPTDPNSTPGPPPTVAGGFPEACGGTQVWQSPTSPGRLLFGSRNISMDMLETSINLVQLVGTDRPILDKTGLTGAYDFVMEFAPDPQQVGPNFQSDANGPTFLEAMREQLGLKFESQTGPASVVVVDHVEEPTPN